VSDIVKYSLSEAGLYCRE